MAQVLSHSVHSLGVRGNSPESEPLPSENVIGTINYLDPVITHPFYIRSPKPDEPETNVLRVPYEVEIEDIRNHKEKYNLDNAGFQVIDDSEHDPEYALFSDDNRIEEEYYPQIENIIKKHTGASKVLIFDHTLRRRQEGAKDSVNNRQPVQSAHVDQTEVGAVNRVRRYLGDEADAALQKRVRLINVWRPLFDDNTDHPLAFADYNSVDHAKDLVVSELRYPEFVGFTYAIRHNPNHKWKYFSHQNKNDVLLIKCYDSQEDVARLTPHTAFTNPRTPLDARPRESIEVRALVFE